MSVEKKVPEVRFKGFSEAWVENNLGELIDIRSAARVHKEKWTEAGVPFLRTSDVVSIYKGKENTKAYISHEVYNALSEKIGKVTKDDLLITGGGSIGIPYLVLNDNPLYFKDADLLWLKNNKKINGYFLYTFFFSAPFIKHIKSISHTGTIAHYTIEQAKATPINTCYDEEQTQIGNYFQKLDALINQHQQKHDKLSNIKKAMLEKMFPKPGETVPEIRFKGFSGEWEEREFSDIATRISTHHQSTLLPCVEYEDIVTGKGRLNKDIHQKKTFKAGLKFESDDVLFGKLRPYLKNWFLADFEGLAVGDFWVLRANNVASTFLFSLIQTNGFELISNLSAGSKMPRSDWGLVSSSCFFVPKNISESNEIGSYFQKLDALINQHQQQITKLNNIKQACLSKMFV